MGGAIAPCPLFHQPSAAPPRDSRYKQTQDIRPAAGHSWRLLIHPLHGARKLIPMSNAKPTTTYVTAAPATWELIRAAYLSGLSAPAVAARFGVSVSALRQRARRKGWTKAAQARARAPEPAPSHVVGLDAALPPLRFDPEVAARQALAQAVEALRQGRAHEARALARAAREIAALNDLIPQWDGQETPEQAQARHSILKQAAFEQAIEIAEALLGRRKMPKMYAEMAAAYGWEDGKWPGY